jgi:hypothetical protein
MKISFDAFGQLKINIFKEDGKYVLSWWDYVANELEERYDSLAHALIRAACLTRLCEVDDKGGSGLFNHFDEEFERFADKVLSEAVDDERKAKR